MATYPTPNCRMHGVCYTLCSASNPACGEQRGMGLSGKKAADSRVEKAVGFLNHILSKRFCLI